MKKKILILTLVLALLLSSMSFSYASSSFTDITDEKTATAVEVLKLMGVVDGTGDGTYNPTGVLSRAEFCKLAVVSMHTDADFNKYSSMTIFPDAKAGEWFAPYVNMAAKLGIVTGCPDGTFKPGNKISLGEAVTLLLRLIGYTDEEIGGVWPYGHVSFAKESGLLAGVKAQTASSTMTRADAALLFVNTIKMDAQNKGTSFTFSDETVLKSVNAGSKTITTSIGTFKTAKSLSDSTLVGKTGYVVVRKDGKAVSFVPSTMAGTQSGVVVILTANSDAQLTTVAGRTDYTIYKNGAKISASGLRTNDVAVYRADENKFIVCDTKLTAMYENVPTNPSAPTEITMLGHEFEVLSSAQSSISNFKQGTHLSLLLTADGKVASVSTYGYTGGYNNAVFIVDTNGNADLICGNEIIDMNVSVDSSLCGKAVRLVAVKAAGEYTFEDLSTSNGSLNKEAKTVGRKKIADNALIFENGRQTSLSLASGSIVSYARENVNGELDLVVVTDYEEGVIQAGEAITALETETLPGSYGQLTTDVQYLTLNNHNGSVKKLTNDYSTETKYVITRNTGKYFTDVKKLTKGSTVSKDAFTSETLVNVYTKTYSVFSDVACYNKDTQKWTSITEALSYGRTFNLYMYDSTVYVITYEY